MTSSRSNGSTNKRWLVALLLLVGLVGTAHAEKRKRVVVLPFEGDAKAEKFHEAVIKLVKKSHTVVSADKWEGAAEEMSAAKLTDKNIKKVAKKLKVDGVIEGKIEKRRDSYLIKLKLHAGTSGVVVNSVDTKAEGPRLDGSASRDVKDELIEAIGQLDSVRDGASSDDEEEAKPVGKKKGKSSDDEEDEPKPAAKKKNGKAADDEEETKPVAQGKKKNGKAADDEEAKPVAQGKKKNGKAADDEETKPVAQGKKKNGKAADDEEAKPVAKKKNGKAADDEEEAKPAKASKFGSGQMKKGDEEAAALKTKKSSDDEEENPLPKGKRPAKADPKGDDDEVASSEKKGDDEIQDKAEPKAKMDAAVALSPGNRAIDATLGLNVNARRLTWKHDADLPPSQGELGQGRPPAYKGTPAPGAVIDLTGYPLAFGHSSTGMLKNLGATVMYEKALLISSEAGGEKKDTQASRYAVGAVFRYPFGTSATAPVVGARLRFGGQKFQIAGGVDIPNVNYFIIDPGLFINFPVNEKIIVNLTASYMLIRKTGQMSKTENYGNANVNGFEAELGGDYAITRSIFARAALRVESIGYKFKGDGMLTTARDADVEQDVFGARDTYIGGALTVGYLY